MAKTFNRQMPEIVMKEYDMCFPVIGFDFLEDVPDN